MNSRSINGTVVRIAAMLSLLYALPGQAEAASWGEYLNPGGSAPLGSFRVFYINTQRPHEVVASETVPDVSINYSWAEFHDIKSEDFGAYWVGRIDYKAPAARIIEVSQSWAHSRISVDRKVVYEGGQDARVPFTFSKGRHLIEVEFINNWHTTAFHAGFEAESMPLSRAEVASRLEAGGVAGAPAHFVGVYESSARDMSVTLGLQPTDAPVVLVLSSYDSVNWVVEPGAAASVKAVVFSSLKPGSAVHGVDRRKTLVLPAAGWIEGFRVEQRCDCVGGVFHCESGNLKNVIADTESLTRAKVASFSGKYSADHFDLPGEPVSEGRLVDAIRQDEDKNRRLRATCEKKADPDFDHMFDKQ
jgi:hypothetical protein